MNALTIVEATTANTAQMNLLEADVMKILVGGSIKKAMADANDGASGQSRDLWQVNPGKLTVVENLNPRVDTPAYRAHIRALADSMKINGFFQDKPLAGYVAKEDGKDVIYIYEGGSRLKAANLAISEGAKFTKVPVSVDQNGKSMEDLNVAMVRGNTGMPLTAYETAIVCKRLVQQYNMPVSEAAEKLGFTVQHVENLLKLMASDHRIRALVANDFVSFTMAINKINEHGAKAFEVLEKAQVAAATAGKTRITERFTVGAAFKKASKRAAEPMFNTLQKIKADPAFAGLQLETQAMLMKLVAELEAAKAADAPAPAQESNVVLLKAA